MKLTRIIIFIVLVIGLMKHHLCEPVWNLAFNKTASQSKRNRLAVAERSVDGVDGLAESFGSCSSSKGSTGMEHKPWWEVDLAQEYYIKGVAISQSNFMPQYEMLTHNFTIEIYGENKTVDDAILCYYQEAQAEQAKTKLYFCVETIRGRYVRITVHGQPGDRKELLLCEVRVFGSYDSVSNFVKMEGAEIAGAPFDTRIVNGHGACAMRCYALPNCRIFSVKVMSDVYNCSIYTTVFLVANSTGSPETDIFIL